MMYALYLFRPFTHVVIFGISETSWWNIESDNENLRQAKMFK